MEKVIILNLPDGKPYRFVGDVDAFVSDEGVLTIVNYHIRDEGQSSGTIFAASRGCWLHLSVEPKL
jgi:hypothetical protein